MDEINPYAGLADQLHGEEKPVDQGDNPYSGLADQLGQDKTSQLRGSMAVAAQTEPDRHAQVLDLAQKAKLPPSFVESKFDQIKKHYETESVNYESLIKDNPKTADFLQNPNNAAVAKDDIDNLKNIENTHKDFEENTGIFNKLLSAATALHNFARDNSFVYGASTWVPSHLSANELGNAYLYANTQIAQNAARIPGAFDAIANSDIFKNSGRMVEGMNLGPDQKKRLLGQMRGLDERVYQTLTYNDFTNYLEDKKDSYKIPEMGESVVEHISKGSFEKAGRALAIQFVTNAPQQALIMASPIFGLAYAGASEATNTFVDNKEKGLSSARAGVNALVHGAAEAGFEHVGTFGILHSWEEAITRNFGKQVSKEVFKDLGKTLAYSVLGEGTEELATSFAQDFSDKITGANPDLGIGEATVRGLDAFLAGGFSGLALVSPTAALNTMARHQQVLTAQRAKDFFLSFGKSVEASKLRERLPEAQRAYIESLTKDTPVEKIYVSPEAFDAYFQSQQLNPVAVATELGVGHEYDAAKKSGLHIEIPVATFATKMVGEGHFDGLANDIKFDPSHLSVNEAKAERTELAQQMEDLVNEALDQNPTPTADGDTQTTQGAEVPRVSLEDFNSPESAAKVLQTRERAEALEKSLTQEHEAALARMQAAGDFSKADPRDAAIMADTSQILTQIQAVKDQLPGHETLNEKIGKQLKEAGLPKQQANDQTKILSNAISAIASWAGIDTSQLPSLDIRSGEQAPQPQAVASQSQEEAAHDEALYQRMNDETSHIIDASDRFGKTKPAEPNDGKLSGKVIVRDGEHFIRTEDGRRFHIEQGGERHLGNEVRFNVNENDAAVDIEHVKLDPTVEKQATKLLGKKLSAKVSDFGKKMLNGFSARFGGEENSKAVNKAIKAAQDPKLGPYVRSEEVGDIGWIPNYAAEPTGTIGAPEITHQTGLVDRETDPFKWSDDKYQATRELLKKHAEANMPTTINTSSDLIGKQGYIELIPQGSTVNMYLLTQDPTINRILFPGNPSRLRQENAVEKLKEAGVRVRAIRPTFDEVVRAAGGPENVERLLGDGWEEALKKAVGPALRAVDGGQGFFQSEVPQGHGTYQEAAAEKFKAILAQPDAVEKYAAIPDALDGKLLDTDLARQLLPEYNENPAAYVSVTHGPAGMFIWNRYLDILKQPPTGAVILMGGGSAAGKTTILNNMIAEDVKDADVIYDGTLANLDEAHEKIEIALDSGRPVRVSFVYRDVEEAANSAANRFGVEQRNVPPDALTDAHVKSLENILRLAEEYKGSKEVTFRVFTNIKNQIQEIPVEGLKDLRYIIGNETADQASERIKPRIRERLDHVEQQVRQAVERAQADFARTHQESGRDDGSLRSESGRGPEGNGSQGSGGSDTSFFQPTVEELKPSGQNKSHPDDRGYSLFQPLNNGARGRLVRMNNHYFMDLFRGRDASTPIHEGGHYYLELMEALEPTSPKIAQELGIIRSWWTEKADHVLEAFDKQIANIKDVAERTEDKDRKTDLEEQHKKLTRIRSEIESRGGAEFIREVAKNRSGQTDEAGKHVGVLLHEYLARGFEAYLMEGKAPNEELRGVFNRMKAWLIEVYKHVTNLDVQLTDEMRDFMGRLYAGQQAVDHAANVMKIEALFKDPRKAGMSEEMAYRYLNATAWAREEAERKVTEDLMKHMRRKRQREYKAKYAQMSKEVAEALKKIPAFRATMNMQYGKGADGNVLPHGQQVKLDRQALIDAFGPEVLKELPRPLVYAKEGGIHHDIVAESFGFSSGTEMVEALKKAENPRELIKRLTEEEMAHQFPDLLTDGKLPEEAIKAAHNDRRAEMLKIELEYLAQNDMPVLKEVIRKVARRVPTIDVVREEAQRTVGERNVRDLNPALFQRAEIKAAKQAGELLAKGDIQGAFDAKIRELLNHELYRAAVNAQEEIEKSLEKFKRLNQKDADLAKTLDMDFVNAARSILSRFGIGSSKIDVGEAMDQIKRYADPDEAAALQNLVDMSLANGFGYYRERPLNDFMAMKDTVTALMEMAREKRLIELDGKKRDINDIREDLHQHLAAITPQGKVAPGTTRGVTAQEKRTMGFLSLRAALTRVESWARRIDGGEAGLFTKFFVQPVVEATAKYRLEQKKMLKKFLEIIEPIRDELGKKEILAPELSYTFKSKAELLGALLHTGNESNFSKLLRGRNWGSIGDDGSLDSSRWNRFIERMWREGVLTKAHYDVIQKIWDLFEESKPQAQKAHKKMYGHYFNEITAKEFQTPFGTYRGGYVPARVDPFMNEDAAIRADKAVLESTNNAGAYPTTGRGFTKSRVDNYAAPLAMDLRLMPQALDGHQRFIHIEPVVKDVMKVLGNREFRAALGQYDSEVAKEMLVPWLQRTASQRVDTPAQGRAGKMVDSFARLLRRRAGMATMVLNVTNAFQNFTGLSLAAVRVKPALVADGLWQYTRAPKKTTAWVTEKSDFMKTKVGEQSVEIQKHIDDIVLDPSKFDQFRDAAIKHGYFLQIGTQNVMDIVSWVAGYNEATEKGMEEKEAIRYADAVVRETQGSMNPEDISKAETGSGMMRLFTMFYSYFNMHANLLGTEFALARELGLKKGMSRGLYVYTFGLMIPAVVAELIARAMYGKFDEDDDGEYLDDFVAMFFGSQGKLATAMVPGVGSAVNSLIAFNNDRVGDDKLSLSPAINMLERTFKATNTVRSLFKDDHDMKKADVQDLLTAVSLLSGVPVAPLGKPAGYLMDVNSGKAQPDNPLDFARGLVSGKPGASH